MLPTLDGCHGRARGEASGKEKRIRISHQNICGTTPFVSQNHVLTTLRAGSSQLEYCTTNLHNIHPSRCPPPSAHHPQPEGVDRFTSDPHGLVQSYVLH